MDARPNIREYPNASHPSRSVVETSSSFRTHPRADTVPEGDARGGCCSSMLYPADDSGIHPWHRDGFREATQCTWSDEDHRASWPPRCVARQKSCRTSLYYFSSSWMRNSSECWAMCGEIRLLCKIPEIILDARTGQLGLIPSGGRSVRGPCALSEQEPRPSTYATCRTGRGRGQQGVYCMATIMLLGCVSRCATG